MSRFPLPDQVASQSAVRVLRDDFIGTVKEDSQDRDGRLLAGFASKIRIQSKTAMIRALNS
jgi:hypothetical protein